MHRLGQAGTFGNVSEGPATEIAVKRIDAGIGGKPTILIRDGLEILCPVPGRATTYNDRIYERR